MTDPRRSYRSHLLRLWRTASGDEWGCRAFEFGEDGTWHYFEYNMEVPSVSGNYATTCFPMKGGGHMGNSTPSFSMG